MPDNYDGLHELRIFYSTTIGTRIIPHRFSIDFKQDLLSGGSPGDPFSLVTVETHGGAPSTLEDEMTALLTVLRPNWRPTTEFTHAEFWQYFPEPSTDAVFMGAETLGLAGTAGAGADTAAQQDLFTFRTAGGGVMKVQLMETISVSKLRQTPPFSPSPFEAIRTYFIALNHPWVGRDNTRPLAAIACSSGENEKLARKRFRE